RLNKRTVLVILMLGSVVAALLGPKFAERLRLSVQWALMPLSDPAMFVTTEIRSHITGRSHKGISSEQAHRLADENKQLRAQIRTIEGELSRFLRLRQGERDFRQRYGRSVDLPIELIPARVVSGDSQSYGATRLIDFGSNQGAWPGLRVTERNLLTGCSKALLPNLMAVTSSVLVGRLRQTGAFAARLELVTDSRFEIDARIRRRIDTNESRHIRTDGGRTVRLLTRENNVPIDVKAQGDGVAGLIIHNVKEHDSVQAGDLLVTRNNDAFLPAEVYIGEVTEIANDAEHPGFLTVRVRPYADLDALREVYIVLPKWSDLDRPLQGGVR
ncbi:MAG: rod shape-determining protein MreC, partial [Phycisphaerae bacterium]|nr:rod shape-determining protein MreC [Phycisphaerae bacterium]